MRTPREREEFINLPLFGLNDETIKTALIALPVDAAVSQPRRFHAVRHHIVYLYGEPFARRFDSLLRQATAIGHSFALHGLNSAAAGFATVGTLVTYLQSRRRHLVAMLYTLPSACTGSQPVEGIDTLNHFLPLVELNGINLTGLRQQAMLAEVFPDYALVIGPGGFRGLRDYSVLDGLFLEPERASVVEMLATSSDGSVLASLETVLRNRLFSAAELRNDICLLENSYAEFDLANSDFSRAADLVRHLSEITVDDYWISITLGHFTELVDEVGLAPLLRRALVHRSRDYESNINSCSPFFEIAGQLRTSVTLLSRFLYHWKNVCLYKVRKFQIRSGYIFEKTVAAALTEQNFDLTDIKRLNHKEFDVVTIRDKVIFNFQCKNNFVDLTRLVADVRLFARYNRALASSYERALRKEEAREDLLKSALSLSRIEHFVVTRFPIATENRRIISFNRIDELGALADALTAGVAI